MPECFGQKTTHPPATLAAKGSQSKPIGSALMQSDTRESPEAPKANDAARREILDILFQSGLAPSMGVEDVLSRWFDGPRDR